MAYPNVESQPNFPALEERHLERWRGGRRWIDATPVAPDGDGEHG